jgi:hypothetical protein
VLSAHVATIFNDLEHVMNARKASHKAAHRSLDGHVRFVVEAGRSIKVLDIGSVATRGDKVGIIAAYSKGKRFTPRSH